MASGWLDTWSEINANYRVTITPKFSNSKLLGIWKIPMNPTGASNILMALIPWYSTNGGTTKNIISTGITLGSRHNINQSWFISNNL